MPTKYHKKPVTKRMIIVIVALAIIFGAIFGWGFMRSYFMARYFATFTPPPVTVSSAKAKAETWQPYVSAVGGLRAINGVNVSSEVPGMIVKIYFSSGQIVKQGEPLVQLDDSTDVQDYKNFQAQLKLSEINYMRQSKLYKTRSTAASALDEARARLQELQAQTEKTRLLIEKKKVKAPFAGKAGIAPVDVGQYVDAGTKLVNLQELDPLKAEFNVPEQQLKVLSVGQPVQVTVEAYGDENFPGKVIAIDSQVNPQTRNILISALIPNQQQKLYPGMFANVRVLLPQQNKIVTVPQTAVIYNLFGDSVYVIKEEGKDKSGKPILRARMRYVVAGERRDNVVVITKGLNPGEEVVTSGQLKLQEGAQVIINNSVTPSAGNM